MMISQDLGARPAAGFGSGTARLESVSASHWLASVMRQLAAVLLLVVAGGVARGANLEPVTVEARREGDAVIVEAHALLHVDLETAWNVLTDYDRYAEFIPDLKSSRTVSRSDANRYRGAERSSRVFSVPFSDGSDA